ncbi:MAG: DegV family EDD domain-containing protein [Lachnospiraceae bacterium]|nr:DegV family EDD domain-containing protein [Lachnospiraceae bacterium]
MRDRFRTWAASLFDPEKDFRERTFQLIVFIAIAAVFLAALGDLLSGENVVETVVLFVSCFMAVFVAAVTLKRHQVQLGGALITGGIIFVIHPVTFFFGGGLEGGSVLWISCCFLFIGLILTGRLRIIMLVLMILLTAAEFIISYFFPEVIVSGHTRELWYVDMAISAFVVGLSTYIMVWFQSKLYTVENNRTREQAKQIETLNQAQNRFFSSMSHEIRTPINTIIGLNEMILREDVSDEVAEDARNIQSASKTLLSLINDILDMSKIESGRMDILPAPYDVGKMLSELVNMIWIRAKEKNLQFTVDVDPSLPEQLYSDEVRIKQILINLLNNAIKYTEEGKVSLGVHCRKIGERKVVVTYTVEDTGMGIRKESIPHLFDAFRREDESKNRYIEGTGLGLSIVKQLVDLMGGEITVNSVYTKGSTFEVILEQEIVSDKVLGKYDPTTMHRGAQRNRYHQSFEAPEARVLIVDDDPANLMVAEKLLRETMVQITTARSGAEALDHTLEQHFDAIFMDHLMPGMDGIECLHAIREQSGGLNKETPVAALTANAGSANQALYRHEGFDGYLVKPVDAALFEDLLLSMLPQEIVQITDEGVESFASDKIVRALQRKVPLLITTDSISDLPKDLLNTLKIPVLSYKVYMEGGVFSDGLEAEGDVIIRYMGDRAITARSEAPEVSEYEEFFSRQLLNAQHVIHLVMSRHTSRGYENATEAALAFYNVRVYDSGHLSSGTGLLTLYAKKLTDSGITDAETLTRELDKKRAKIQTSFIVDSPDYLYRSGRLSRTVQKLCRAFLLHPVLRLKNGYMTVGAVIVGNTDRARSIYIRNTLRNPEEIDRSMLFITYVGMKKSEVEAIREEVLKKVPFEKVYLQKASPAVSINSGPGTFGLLFMRK